MKTRAILNREGLLSLLVGGLVTAAVAGLLWATALAPERSRRTADIERLNTLEPIGSAASASRSPFPAGAVCPSDLEAAEALLRIRLTEAAQAVGVRLESADLSKEPGEPLSAVILQIRVEGSYASGLNFLKILADGTPTVFVQRLAAVPGPSESTSWEVSGRVYCAVRLSA